jgi:hypothetical protein
VVGLDHIGKERGVRQEVESRHIHKISTNCEQKYTCCSTPVGSTCEVRFELVGHIFHRNRLFLDDLNTVFETIKPFNLRRSEPLIFEVFRVMLFKSENLVVILNLLGDHAHKSAVGLDEADPNITDIETLSVFLFHDDISALNLRSFVPFVLCEITQFPQTVLLFFSTGDEVFLAFE